jgi:predicted Fe-S protein YdhL (DUF1289 family)
MEQIEFFEIRNPCISVCQNGPRGFCKGCYRSREERQHWNSLDDSVKRKVIQACANRKRRHLAKKAKAGDDSDEISQDDLF